MIVSIRYVSGHTKTGPPEIWHQLPADGVDRIELIGSETTRYVLMGHSIYWCRDDDGTPVFGGGDVTARPLPEGQVGIEEVRFSRGRFYRRVLDSMPDVRHQAVKLGWWL